VLIMDEHEQLVEQVKIAIQRNTQARLIKNFRYALEEAEFEIDLLVLIEFTLCIIEAKVGVKERKARKQLAAHKSCILFQQPILQQKQNLMFSKVKTFWISLKERKVVETETNEEMEFYSFLENPIVFLMK